MSDAAVVIFITFSSFICFVVSMNEVYKAVKAGNISPEWQLIACLSAGAFASGVYGCCVLWF